MHRLPAGNLIASASSLGGSCKFLQVGRRTMRTSAAGSDETYNRLVEDMAAFISKRTGDARGGLILLKRANQLDIESDRLDVIRLLGRATGQLAQREHVESFIEAAYSLAVAYRGAGMLWAARARGSDDSRDRRHACLPEMSQTGPWALQGGPIAARNADNEPACRLRRRRSCALRCGGSGYGCGPRRTGRARMGGKTG